MPDRSAHTRCDARRRKVWARLPRAWPAPLLLSLSAIPGLVSLQVHKSIPFAAVVTVLTAIGIAAAAVLLRPR